MPRIGSLREIAPDGIKPAVRLADQIYEKLLEQIIQGKLPVGQRVPSEAQLCELLGVSRPVVREAIARLQADDIVTTRKGSGTYVTRRPAPSMLSFAPPGGIADLMRCYEFRIPVEGEAAFLAARRRTEEDMAEIEAALAALSKAVDRQELGVEADMRLHGLIARAAKNEFFVAELSALSAHMINGMKLTRGQSLTRQRRRQMQVQDEHCAVVAAIRAQDDEAARTAMRAHLDNARKRALDDSSEPE